MDWTERVIKATRQRSEANHPIWKLIGQVKTTDDLGSKEKETLLASLYGSLSDKNVLQPLVSEAQNYHVGTSFRSSITDLLRTKRRMRRLGINILPGQNPKLVDREFGKALGIAVPETYAQGAALSDVVLLPNSILKPTNGSSSKGVFHINESSQLHSVRTSTTYNSLEDARVEIMQYRSSISEDSWLTEQVILGSTGRPANDLKVYAFYGEPGMFLEIHRNMDGKTKNATFDSSGQPMELGPNYEMFAGTGLPQEAWELSKTLSLAAPAPFMRLDFHCGADRLYLGEITPHPGGTYAGQLYDSVDKMLGQHFADAKVRLFRDLLGGKSFPEFNSIYGVSYEN